MKIKKPKSTKHYVNNKEFLEGIIDYKQKLRDAEALKKPKPQMSNFLGDCFLKIAKGYSLHHWFSGYDFKEDMIMDAVYVCIKYIDTFDPGKTTNAFAYFTQAIHFSFRQKVEKERKYLYTKYKMIENTELFDITSSRQSHDIAHKDTGDGVYYSKTSDEKRREFVENYETSLEKKKNPKKT